MKRILILTFIIISNLCNSQYRTNDRLPVITKNNGVLINAKSCKYYVLSKSECKKIKDIKIDTINNIYLNVVYSNDLKYINSKTFNDNVITKDLSKKMKEEIRIDEYGTNKLALNISYFKEKNIVQFYFYEIYIYKQDYIKMYGSPNPEDNNKYFETDKLTFKQFINIE